MDNNEFDIKLLKQKIKSNESYSILLEIVYKFNKDISILNSYDNTCIFVKLFDELLKSYEYKLEYSSSALLATCLFTITDKYNNKYQICYNKPKLRSELDKCFMAKYSTDKLKIINIINIFIDILSQ